MDTNGLTGRELKQVGAVDYGMIATNELDTRTNVEIYTSVYLHLYLYQEE